MSTHSCKVRVTIMQLHALTLTAVLMHSCVKAYIQYQECSDMQLVEVMGMSYCAELVY